MFGAPTPLIIQGHRVSDQEKLIASGISKKRSFSFCLIPNRNYNYAVVWIFHNCPLVWPNYNHSHLAFGSNYLSFLSALYLNNSSTASNLCKLLDYIHSFHSVILWSLYYHRYISLHSSFPSCLFVIIWKIFATIRSSNSDPFHYLILYYCFLVLLAHVSLRRANIQNKFTNFVSSVERDTRTLDAVIYPYI